MSLRHEDSASSSNYGRMITAGIVSAMIGIAGNAAGAFSGIAVANKKKNDITAEVSRLHTLRYLEKFCKVQSNLDIGYSTHGKGSDAIESRAEFDPLSPGDDTSIIYTWKFSTDAVKKGLVYCGIAGTAPWEPGDTSDPVERSLSPTKITHNGAQGNLLAPNGDIAMLTVFATYEP